MQKKILIQLIAVLCTYFSVHAQFNWGSLTTQSPTTYNAHSGTTVIDGKKFTNLNSGVQGGTCIKIGSTAGTGTITIKNSYFGASIGEAISIENFNGTLLIENCLFANNKGAVYALKSSGIKIKNCQFINPHGARGSRGQALQFDSLVSVSGAFFRNNKGESFRGEGYTEDWVSMYKSSGASCDDPIIIDSNMLRGGGPSTSGGGITTGDNGGGYILVQDNKLLNVGNHIYGCAGGNNITYLNNMGYNEEESWTNVGLYAYGTCNNIMIINNNVRAIHHTLGWNPYHLPTPPDGDACDCSLYAGNTTSVEIEDMEFPAHLIDYVTEDVLWQIRDESVQFRVETQVGQWPPSLHRPTSNAGTDQNISVSSASLSGSGSTSSNGYNYKWVQVSGPNSASISTSTSVGTNVTGLINGTYIFRLVVTDDDGAADADWVTVTVNLIV